MNVLGKVELAHEPDFVLGRLTVSPSRRELVRDDGEREVIEHRVMQVLIALTRAQGDIVTRDELILLCWDGRVVGEDAIHRVMSRLRKIAKGISAGSFEIETITKIGYRLTSDVAPLPASVSLAQDAGTAADELPGKRNRKTLGVAAAVALVLAAGYSAWAYLGGNSPLVAVGPADPSSSSQLLARDLFVKLGTLPQLGSGHWQLVEAQSAPSAPNFVFRAAAIAQAPALHTTLMLLDGDSQRLLWSREFNFPASRESDLRQHMALTAARVLDCALVARKQGGLPSDLFRLFLNGCAALAETSAEDPQKTAGIMRAVVSQRPRFTPAWARLLMVDVNIVQLADNRDGDMVKARNMLRLDIERARKIAPDLPEIQLAQLILLPPDNYAAALALLRKVKDRAPQEPLVWLAEAEQLSRVGRMDEAIAAARRAAELDPLSPALSSSLISILAWSGEIELARAELGRAERLWSGTGALRDAQFAFHLRYGDPRIAQRLTSDAGYVGNSKDPYLQARLDSSDANIDRLLKQIALHKSDRNPSVWAYAVQALADFDRTDEVFDWLQNTPPEEIADGSYILFRPAFVEVRRDRRFMQLAKRIGLVEYWRTSGNWPDFCNEPGLPYDCRREAARLAS